MRYAQILNDKVHWIFEDEMTLDDLGKHKYNLEQIQLIDITNIADVQEGYDYSNGAFVNTAVSTSFADLQKQCIAKFGAEFAKRRDAITWAQHDVGLYGYDRNSEDVTNFMAAMKRAELGLDTGFNVYVNNSDNPKQFLPHTAKMFQNVLEQSAQEQILAYTRYEELKYQIQNVCETIEDLDALTW